MTYERKNTVSLTKYAYVVNNPVTSIYLSAFQNFVQSLFVFPQNESQPEFKVRKRTFPLYFSWSYHDYMIKIDRLT